MKSKSYFPVLLVLFCCLLLRCKKEDPQTTQTVAPVFTFNAILNGTPVKLEAGVNSYYMFTSSNTDTYGVREFIGELKDKNCTANCTSSLKITLRDYRRYSEHATTID